MQKSTTKKIHKNTNINNYNKINMQKYRIIKKAFIAFAINHNKI